jgi:hypothetical protein
MEGRHVGLDFYDFLIEVLYRKRTARQFGLASTSEFAFDTAVRRKPLAGAATRGAMGIQSISA